MNLDYLRYFVKLAEVRHYTRAAEQLGISQPSLSHAISQIEAELGVPLFEKSGRNTILTRFGEEFLRCAENSLSVLDAGIETLQRYGRGEGVIRLGFIRPLGVDYIPKLTADFLAADGGQVQFSFHSGLIDRMYESIGGKPVAAAETEEDEVIAGLVASGFGTAVVPYMDMLEKLNVKILKITDPPYSRKFYMVENDSAFVTTAAQRFRSFVLGRTSELQRGGAK